jgi:hypothetical protein
LRLIANNHPRHHAAVFGRDAAVVRIEHIGRCAEDRHVAVEEQTRVRVAPFPREIRRRPRAMARGHLDQRRDAFEVEARLRPLRELFPRQHRRKRFVVLRARDVDRVVVEDRGRDFMRLRPPRPGGHVDEMLQHFADMRERVIGARRRGIGRRDGRLLRGGQDERQQVEGRVGHGVIMSENGEWRDAASVPPGDSKRVA